MQGMVIQMNDRQLPTLVQLQGFVDGTTTVDFSLVPAERYSFIARILERFGYPRLATTDLTPASSARAGNRQ